MEETKAQQVRWNPVDGGEPGIRIIDSEVIAWPELIQELKTKMLPQVEQLNSHKQYSLVLKDLEEKKNWLVRIIAKDKTEIGGIWFGPNPEKAGAPYDGLIRVGKSFKPPIIWNTFQRYSDNSYRRLESTNPPPPLVKDTNL